MNTLIGIFGILLVFLLVWLLSENKKKFPFRIIIWGIIIQFALAVFVLNVDIGIDMFQWLGGQVRTFLNYSMDSAGLLFGNIAKPENSITFGSQLAIIISVTIIFFSAFVSVLYHLGIIQKVVYAMAWVMQKTMGTSGVESLSASANIFIGQTEAPLLVRHYLRDASRSEINSIMVGGFATIAGGVMAAYIAMGISPVILITASIISAPGGLMLSKIMIPPSGKVRTLKELKETDTPKSENVLTAITNGAGDGMKLSLNIVAMLIAFVAMIAIIDAGLGWLKYLLADMGFAYFPGSLKEILGYIFQPFAYLLSIPQEEIQAFGNLFGTKVGINEFIAFSDLSEMIKSGAISERTAKLATFALCGFANFSSIAIQIGGLGALVPEKKSEIASLGLKAMFIGALTNLLTTMIAGLLI